MKSKRRKMCPIYEEENHQNKIFGINFTHKNSIIFCWRYITICFIDETHIVSSTLERMHGRSKFSGEIISPTQKLGKGYSIICAMSFQGAIHYELHSPDGELYLDRVKTIFLFLIFKKKEIILCIFFVIFLFAVFFCFFCFNKKITEKL